MKDCSDLMLKNRFFLVHLIYTCSFHWSVVLYVNFLQNGTNEEVKKIVATLNQGEVPSEDVVGMFWILCGFLWEIRIIIDHWLCFIINVEVFLPVAIEFEVTCFLNLTICQLIICLSLGSFTHVVSSVRCMIVLYVCLVLYETGITFFVMNEGRPLFRRFQDHVFRYK